MRMEVSARRVAPFASRRFAMLAQATSRTRPEIVISKCRPLPVSICMFWIPAPPGVSTTCCLGISLSAPFRV